MGIIEYTRAAKCKDCKYLYSFQKGKLKRHACGNAHSENYMQTKRLNDLVCNKWKL